MTFGAKLTRLRKRQGLSQRELARRCGWSHLVIHQLERAKLARLDHVGTIAAALRMNPLDVLKGVKFPRRPVRRKAG